jgi:hypothetical protein
MGPVAKQAKPGQPGRKIMKNLNRRVNDFIRTTGSSAFKKPFGSYHKPGSMQK